MRPVYIVEAVRSAVGRRGKDLASVHPAEVLGIVQQAALDRAGVDPTAIGQVVGGCVSQVGEQGANVIRNAWLGQGLPMEVPAASLDSQCGSSQQATTVAAGLVAGGLEDVMLACGVEAMSRIPIGASVGDGTLGAPYPPNYPELYDLTSQFDGAQLIAEEYGITREDTDAFGFRSQQLANAAWDAGHFDREIVPIEAPLVDENGKPTGETQMVTRDGGLRPTTIEGLAGLDPVPGQHIHTAGTSSQISDGAAAVLLASEEGLKRLGVEPRAEIKESVMVGCDPVKMLEGPIPATQKMLQQTGLAIDDIDTFEINEAFASVVLAWEKTLHPPEERVNPKGGAIALGHPLGGTGAKLITTALHELERTDGRYGLVAMCCGGGLGTGTIVERI